MSVKVKEISKVTAVVVKKNDEWQKKAKEYIDIQAQIDALKSTIKALEDSQSSIRDALIGMVDGDIRKESGICVQRIEKRGSVDYAKIPELDCVNLENYRKASFEYWQIKPVFAK